jgi:two-component system, OmpR family, sensor histidine kinase KdpD
MSAPAQPRGKLKIFMGYAAGVGKTYKMLEEAQCLKADGVDVVIGYFEPHARSDTIAKTEGLEFVPRRTINYRDATFEEMDTPAILARRPQVCLVDEFPHTNVPGSERAKRWEDVEALRDGGISVLTTMNVQHLESLNDQVWQITGVRVRETIPDWVVRQADEVVAVDLTPRALLNRLQRGVVYSRDKARHALQNFFRESSLVALRELTLREAAHEVEHRIDNTTQAGETSGRTQSRRKQKILVLVTSDPKTAMAIRRARRVSDFMGAECFAVAVLPSGNLEDLPHSGREAIEKHLNFSRNLHIESRILTGSDVAAVVIDFARRNSVTQIFVTRPRAPTWRTVFRGGPGAEDHRSSEGYADCYCFGSGAGGQVSAGDSRAPADSAEERRFQRMCRTRVLLYLIAAVVLSLLAGTALMGIEVLDRVEVVEAERDRWQRAEEVIGALQLKDADSVADLGCGSGYFTLKLSRAVGSRGRVLAVDVRRAPLLLVRLRSLLEHAGNISLIRGGSDDPGLPPQQLAAVLVANTYHEFGDRRAMLGQIRRALLPAGRLVVVDHDATAGSHGVPLASVAQDLLRAGFEIAGRNDVLVAARPENQAWWMIAGRKPE